MAMVSDNNNQVKGWGNMEINFEDYLTEQERKEIVADVFRSQCVDKFKKDAERIFQNSAYHVVHEIVDKMHDGRVDEIIAEKAKELIANLSVYCVFRRADYWEKGESEGYKSLNQAVLNNKAVLNDKIASLIDGMDEDELRETIIEQAACVINDKLFGKAAWTHQNPST